MIVFRFDRTREAKEARDHLVLFGVHLEHRRYMQPRRPPSGAQLGILESWWIYTDRHAYGRGTVIDWAILDYVEFIAVAAESSTGPLLANRGSMELRPLLELIWEPDEIRSLDTPGTVARWNVHTCKVRITNRNQCGVMLSCHLVVRSKDRADFEKSQAFRIYLNAGQTRVERFEIKAPELTEPVYLEGVWFYSEPATSFVRRERIHGRPEPWK